MATLTRGVALGFYISRLWLSEIEVLTGPAYEFCAAIDLRYINHVTRTLATG